MKITAVITIGIHLGIDISVIESTITPLPSSITPIFTERINNLIAELSDPKQDIENNFIEPFKKELDINVLNKESQDGIRIVLRHYINEFMRANVFFNKHKQILYHNRYIGEKSSEYSSPPSWDSIKCSEFGQAVVRHM